MGNFCKQCGGPLGPQSRFCRACGTPVQAGGVSAVATRPPGPVRYVINSLKDAFAGMKAAFKSPKMLLPTIVMSLVWTALSYLKLLLPDSVLVYAASLLTFAQGGMYGGFFGAVGGLVGKALLSYLLSVTLMPLLTGQKRQPKPRAPATRRRGMFPYVLGGLGCALVAYHFMTGNASLENAMVGIGAFTACRRQRKSDNGFVVGLVLSFTKGRFTRADARPFLGGLMAGFLCGVGFSLLQVGKLSGPLGLVLAVLALILGLLTRSKRARAFAAACLLLGGVVLGFAPTARAAGAADALAATIGQSEYAGTVAMDGNTMHYSWSGGTVTRVYIEYYGSKIELDEIDPAYTGYLDSLVFEGTACPGETLTLTLTGSGSGELPISTLQNVLGPEDDLQTEVKEVSGSGEMTTTLVCTVPEGLDEVLGAGMLTNHTDAELGDDDYLSTGTLVAFEYTILPECPHGGHGNEPPVEVDGYWTLRERSVRLYSYYGDADVKPGRDYTGPDEYLTVTENNEIFSTDMYDLELGISFSAPPGTLLPGQPLIIENPSYQFETYAHGVFYGKNPPPGNVDKDASYLDMGQTRFDKFRPDGTPNDGTSGEAGQYFLANIPPGGSEGEILVVTLFAGTQTEDVWINYIYDWEVEVFVPGIIDDDSDPEEDFEDWDDEDDYGDSDNWEDWEGWDDWNDWSGWEDWDLSGGDDPHTEPLETGIIDIIAILSAILGLGGAGGLGGGGGGGDLGPHIVRDGDGDLIATDPATGQPFTYVKNPDGTYTNPVSGVTVTEESLREQMDYRDRNKDNFAQDDETARQAIEDQRQDNQLPTPVPNESKQLDYIQKLIDRLRGDNNDYADSLANKLEQIKSGMVTGGSLSPKELKLFKDNYQAYRAGNRSGNGSFPPGASDWDAALETALAIGDELARPTTIEGYAGRALLAMATGGASEYVLSPAGALLNAKDVIDAGGSEMEAYTVYGTNVAIDAAFGAALKGASNKLLSNRKLSPAQASALSKAKSQSMKAAGQRQAAKQAAAHAKKMGSKANALAKDAAQAKQSLNIAAMTHEEGVKNLTKARGTLSAIEKQQQRLLAGSKGKPPSAQVQNQLRALEAEKQNAKALIQQQTRVVQNTKMNLDAAKKQVSQQGRAASRASVAASEAKLKADALKSAADKTAAQGNQLQKSTLDSINKPAPAAERIAEGTNAASGQYLSTLVGGAANEGIKKGFGRQP